MSVKTAAVRLLGLTPSDIFFLKSLRHSWWLRQFWRLPLSRFEFPPLQPIGADDLALSARIVVAYTEAGQRSTMWDRYLAGPQAPLVDALRNRDVEGLAHLLNGFLRSQIVLGIDPGDSYKNWRIHSLKLLDALVSLAEQIGVVPTESGQGAFGTALAEGVEALCNRIEDRIGLAPTLPNIGGIYGLRIGDEFVTMNSPEYLLVAWRLTQVGQGDVLEIGPGFGGTAYYFLKLTSARYTMIDLPEIAALQSYYMGKCFGPDSICLYGENGPGRIRILPPQALSDVGKVDIAFNQDSLPEIPHDAAKAYVEWIRDNASAFFSYNHETLSSGQFAITSVPAIAEEVGLKRVSRNLSWSRPGYVEEVYAVTAYGGRLC